MFWIDLIIIGLLVFGAYQGFRRGFMAQLFQILSVIAAFIVALATYSTVGDWMEHQLQIPLSFARPIALAGMLIILGYVFEIIAGLVQRLVAPILQANPLNRALGAILGGTRQLLFISIALAVLITLPFPDTIKKTMDDSTLASPLIRLALKVDQATAKLLHNDTIDSLNYRIVDDNDSTTTALNYTVANPPVDEAGEAKLFVLTNTARQKASQSVLLPNDALRNVARAHAKDMLQRGYFSHISPQGKDVVARVKEANITLLAVGENLATAPTVEIAQTGLFNSEGHRKNMLSKDFNAVGIGVVDAGVHGKMVVEVFAKLP